MARGKAHDPERKISTTICIPLDLLRLLDDLTLADELRRSRSELIRELLYAGLAVLTGAAALDAMAADAEHATTPLKDAIPSGTA